MAGVAAVLYASLATLLFPQACSQTTSIDREVKAAPGREVRVGIYTSMCADCTAGPLPAIRLAVAPSHGTVPCDAQSNKCQAMLGG
jgi:uncharacterized membrane protein